jgi:hypothetical protein
VSAARVFGAGLAIAMTFAVAWLSRAPTDFAGDGDALIRLSWRVDGVTVQACETLSEEELAKRPIHMRNPQACIGTIAPFELVATLGGQTIVHDTIWPGGIRGDRPIYVFRDIPVIPGRSVLSVRFEAVVPEGTEVDSAVSRLTWEGEIELAPDDVALLAMDDHGAFVLRTPGPAASD